MNFILSILGLILAIMGLSEDRIKIVLKLLLPIILATYTFKLFYGDYKIWMDNFSHFVSKYLNRIRKWFSILFNRIYFWLDRLLLGSNPDIDVRYNNSIRLSKISFFISVLNFIYLSIWFYFKLKKT